VTLVLRTQLVGGSLLVPVILNVRGATPASEAPVIQDPEAADVPP